MPANAVTSKSESRIFHIRDAEVKLDDANFIVEAFDSTLPYLASIGSGEMWGLIPFSEKPGFIEETLKDIEQSERYRTAGSGDAMRMLIAEIELLELSTSKILSTSRTRADDNKQRFLSVGTATIREDWFPSYVTKQAEHLGLEAIQRQEFKDILYLEVMITDCQTGSACKGAGAALIQSIVEYGRKVGKKALYVDGVSDLQGESN